jgi:2-polyprenyl-3-methyl-5-hydroxy-6-metoxy-1,4-benzoquinol methylase
MERPAMMSWLDRWRNRPRPVVDAPDPIAAPAPVVLPEVVEIDLATALRDEFPGEYPIAAATAETVMARLGSTDLAPLAKHSPSLAGYDWANYLRCSQCRVVRVMRALKEHVARGGRVLDYGSYFGNFSTAAAAMGYRVDAIDSYRSYGAALAPWVNVQRDAGVSILDFADTGYDVEALAGTYDAVICAGVLEHIPHTPRQLLESVTKLLAPGGVLILDTPNLAYLYKRLAMVEGQTIFAPIAQQYFTEIPFEGHHREYTIAEVEWLLQTAGHDIVSIDTFNYSVFGQSRLTGEHLAYYREMEQDRSLREIIFSVSRRRKPAAARDMGH